jgi:hypothetical protein
VTSRSVRFCLYVHPCSFRQFPTASYVSGHGDVDISFVVVPVKGETAVEVAGPVDSQVVAVGLDIVDGMRGVSFG